MSLSSENTVMTMPVTPAYQGCNGGYGFGGDFGSWIILFLLFGIFGGYGNGFGGFGGYGGINSPAGQDKIATLQAENQSLKLAASQADQTAALRATMDANVAELLRRTGHDCPTAAYVVQPPTPVNFPNFCNSCAACNGYGN